jgi:uncharacterized membrane protein YfcA
LDFSVAGADDDGVSLIPVVLAGVGIGFAFGLFGAGGSAFGTPILVLLGVPAPIAIASPLPAVLPSAVVGARQYLRAGVLDRRVARLAVLAAAPTVIVGALLSSVVGDEVLLLASGLLLVVVGVRMVVPMRDRVDGIPHPRVDRTPIVVASVAGAGLVAGLLATGGGIVLVPLFIVAFGFTAARAAGTSLVVAAALTVPTLATHWLLGNIDWSIAAAFALGMVPASFAAARVGLQLPDRYVRPVFGAVVLAFSLWFVVLQVA